MTLIKRFSRNIYFWFFAWLFWMGLIFYFSHMPGSAVYYEPPLRLVLERKGAHVFEYAILLFLSLQFFSLLYARESLKKIILLAIAWTLTYAVSDELHQFFTPYRGAHLRDVAIDILGVMIALIPVLILISVQRKKTLQ